MAPIYVFGDESGNFAFSNKQDCTKYFLVCTATVKDCSVGNELLHLRRQLHWDGQEIKEHFHACHDYPQIKKAVYNLITTCDIRIDATILQKNKTKPSLAQNPDRFYKMAWFLHLKYIIPQIAPSGTEVFAVIATIGHKHKRKIVHAALKDVMEQVAPSHKYEIACWPSQIEPCLQIADYCSWAIQRKYERGDDTWYKGIKALIQSEFQPFQNGQKTYY